MTWADLLVGVEQFTLLTGSGALRQYTHILYVEILEHKLYVKGMIQEASNEQQVLQPRQISRIKSNLSISKGIFCSSGLLMGGPTFLWLTQTAEPTVDLIWQTRMHVCIIVSGHRVSHSTAAITKRAHFCILSTGYSMQAAGSNALHMQRHTWPAVLARLSLIV